MASHTNIDVTINLGLLSPAAVCTATNAQIDHSNSDTSL